MPLSIMKGSEDDRKNMRLFMDGQISGKVVSSPQPTRSARGKRYTGKIIDVSATGMRVQLDLEVSPGTCLNIKVELKGIRRPFKIVGDVIWSAPETFIVGIHLRDRPKGPMLRWEQVIFDAIRLKLT